jgi:capsular polysaccharide biosynthesis protein
MKSQAVRTKRARVADLPVADLPGAEPVRDPVREVAVLPRPTNEILPSMTRHWRLIALITVVTALLAWIVAAVQPKRFQAESIASVSPIVTQLSDSETLHGIDALERRVVVATVAALASSDITQGRTIRTLGGGYGIDATVIPSTNLIRISVQGPDPKQVAAIANRVPSLLDAQTRAMYRVYTVAPVSAAAVPAAPVLPRVSRAVLAGLALGALLGSAIAYLMDRRRTLRSAAH